MDIDHCEPIASFR